MLLKLASWRVTLLVCLSACLQVPAVAASSFQTAVSPAMSGQSGTAVVLDVHTGEVLASYRLDVAARRLAYPGSSIKPFTLMALLEGGKLDTQTVLLCKRHVAIAGHELDCSHPNIKQPLDPAAALAYSCNSYFSTVALRLTAEQLHDSFIREGFASVTSLTTSEASGEVALAHSPEQQQLQAIGEWGVRVTPLELARAYRRLAELQVRHDPKLAPLFDGLEGSVAYGMAHAVQPATEIKVAGKTGTAPADEGQWTHAWFAGYAPAHNPEIVVVVFLEKGHGGSEAAGVARAIFSSYAQSRNAELTSTRAGGQK